MTEKETNQEYERAIDVLISIDFTNTFKKIIRNKAI